MALCNGRGVAGRVAEGATQPEDAEGPGLLPADERPLVSLNLLVYSQMAEQSERPYRQYTWCGVLVLWEIVSKDKNYHLFSTPTVLQLSI